jgi:hypothetical protein
MRVGITGHQDLGPPEAVAWTRAALGRLLHEHHATGGISSLAEGADQLFAEVLQETGLPLLALIPCAGYEKAFRSLEGRKAFARLRGAASDQIQLPYPGPA